MKIHSVTIDQRHGSAYIHIDAPKEKASKRQVNLGDAVILDIGENGKLIGVEILHPDLTSLLFQEDAIRALEKAHVPVKVA